MRLLALLLLLTVSLSGAEKRKKSKAKSKQKPPNKSVVQGEITAWEYCEACHTFVEGTPAHFWARTRASRTQAH
jgi:hypothetical protein